MRGVPAACIETVCNMRRGSWRPKLDLAWLVRCALWESERRSFVRSKNFHAGIRAPRSLESLAVVCRRSERTEVLRPLLCAALCLACSSSKDVVGVVVDGVGEGTGSDVTSSVIPDADVGSGVTVVVTGRPARNWPFSVVAWPLAAGLAEFFEVDRSPNGARVELEGDDAETLLRLVESSATPEPSPSGRVLAVRDHLGELYLIVVQVSS